MVRDYREHCRILGLSEGEALHSTPKRPEVGIHGTGATSDDTARRAGLLSNNERRRMEEEVKAVQYAFGMCKFDTRNGAKIRKIIDLVYLEGTHTMYGAAMEIGLSSHEWAGNLAGRFFQWVTEWFSKDFE